MVESYRQNNPDRVKTSDSRKSLRIVNAICLSEASSNQSGLVSINAAIRLILDRVYPFAGNYCSPNSAGH